MSYKLRYFDLRGLGEPIRFLFAYMGQDYEDNRLPRESWTAEMKKNTKWGKLPVLQIDSEEYSDSVAICRYLAHLADLSGATPLENLKIDEVVGALGDFLSEFRKWVRAENNAEKEKFKKALVEEHIPFYMERFEKTIQENGGYLANGKLSWVDLYFISWSENLESVAGKEGLAKFPGYQALKDKVQNLPGIKAWIQKRPPSWV